MSAATQERALIAPDAPVYITATQAGRILNARPWIIAMLIESGKVGAVRYGRTLLVSAQDVQQCAGVIA